MKLPVDSDGRIPRAGLCTCSTYTGVKKGRCRSCNLTRHVLCPFCKEYTTRALKGGACLGCNNGATAPIKGGVCGRCGKDRAGLNLNELCYECSAGIGQYQRCQFCDKSMFSLELMSALERCPSCNAKPLPSPGKLDSCEPARGGGKNRPPVVPMEKDEIRHTYKTIQKKIGDIERRSTNLEKMAGKLGKEASLLGMVHNRVECRAIFAHRKIAIKSAKRIRKEIPTLQKDLGNLRQIWREIKLTQSYPVEPNGPRPRKEVI